MRYSTLSGLAPRALVAAGVLAACSPGPTTAQSIAVTPFVGFFAPVSDYVVENEFLAKHAPGFAAGARLTYQTAGRLGFAAEGAYAASDLDLDDEGTELTMDAHVIVVSGTVRYQLLAPDSRVHAHLAAGVAVLTRGGAPYDEFEWSDMTDFGGVLGGGVSFPLSERLRVAIELEDFISSASVQEDEMTSESRLQNDFLLTAGVAIPIGTGR